MRYFLGGLFSSDIMAVKGLNKSREMSLFWSFKAQCVMPHVKQKQGNVSLLVF